MINALKKTIANIYNLIVFKKDRYSLNRLMNQGLKIGKNVMIMDKVVFDQRRPYLIEIGDNCRIAREVRILTHDATFFKELGITKIAPVKILEDTFVGERVIIMPGVTIGPRAVVAAGSVVTRDIGENYFAAGNPARPFGKVSDILQKYVDNVKENPIFDISEFSFGELKNIDILESIKKYGEAYVKGMPKENPYFINEDIEAIKNQVKINLKSYNF